MKNNPCLDIDNIKDESNYINRQYDRGIINEENGASLTIKQDGSFVASPAKDTQNKKNGKDSKDTSISIQKNIIANRINIKTDEVIVNNHKLNNQLYEINDFKDNNGNIMGRLSMQGSILVKVYEPHLNKYVFIRRPIYVPIFSNQLNNADVNKLMGIDTDISNEIKNMKTQQENNDQIKEIIK